jgi:CO/xanthine dehydrogenase Mo-binding subunit
MNEIDHKTETMTSEDQTFIVSKESRIDEPRNGMVGKRVPVRDGRLKATGQFKYVADLKFPRMLYGKILTSPVPHAKIKNINTEKAWAVPGVKAVVCYKDAPRLYFNSCGETIEEYQTERLFDDTVRYVGDIVAAVAAEDEKSAEKAVKLIEVDYEELPANFDPEKGLADEAYVIHHTSDLEKGNLIVRVFQEAGNVEAGFAEADAIFEDRYTLPPIHHGTIETRACIANYDSMGKLTVYAASQDSFAIRYNLAKIFNLPMSKVRVIVPGIGGGFGGKVDVILEHITSLLAIKTGRPVKLQLNRHDDICSTRTRHSMIVELKTGVKRDGTITAEEVKMICNAGAYASGSSTVVWAQCGKFFKVHKTKNLRYTGLPVITNTPIAGAMRGYGSPQLFFAQQCQMNKIANKLGIDMIDLQRKNLTGVDGVDARDGVSHGSPHPLDCLEKAANLIEYENAVEEQKASTGRYRIGVGLAVGVHGNGTYGFRTDTQGMILKMNDDGSVVLFTSSHEMGNLAITTQSQMISEELGISLDRIEFIQADTDTTLYQMGDYASRGAFLGCHAALTAAKALRDKLQPLAAELLGVDESDLTFHNDAVHCSKGSVTLSQVAMLSRTKYAEDLCVVITHKSFALAHSYGAHYARVLVDTETGEVKVLEYSAVHDVGRVLNPLGVEGQIEGAVQMGMGWALCEGLALDDKGRVRNTSLKSYPMIHAAQMPEKFHIGFIEELEYGGPFGAKSIGECSLVPVVPAIVNAISNAVGVDFKDLPVTPDKILAALKKQSI